MEDFGSRDLYFRRKSFMRYSVYKIKTSLQIAKVKQSQDITLRTSLLAEQGTQSSTIASDRCQKIVSALTGDASSAMSLPIMYSIALPIFTPITSDFLPVL